MLSGSCQLAKWQAAGTLHRNAGPPAVGTVRLSSLVALCGRYIGKPEVLETLAKGSINDRKSRPRLQPCPKYVVDASLGPSGKNVQVRARGAYARFLSCALAS